MRVGILTGGGDAPGLNAVIRAVVKGGVERGFAVHGISNGFEGLLDPVSVTPLGPADVRGLVRRGGTILGTSNRGNPFAWRDRHRDGRPREGEPERDRSDEVLATVEKLGLDVIIVLGGDGSLAIANLLAKKGLDIVAVPKTIDSDIRATEATFGHDTALAVATDAIDRLQTTAESHHRVMYLEVMGRHAGWIALGSGMAAGADVILIPEIPFRVQAIAEHIERRRARGRWYTIAVVAEGAVIDGGEEVWRDDAAGGARRLGGIAERVAAAVGEKTGLEYRVTTLGHIQRGGSPTPRDRILATRFGAAAVRAVADGRTGIMIGLRGDELIDVPLEKAAGGIRRVDPKSDLVLAARELGVSLGDR